jgi:hypothetical protein
MTKTTVSLVGGNGGVHALFPKSVADILERELDATIHDWMGFVEKDPELSCIPLTMKNAPAIFRSSSMT